MNRPPAFQFYPKDWMDFKVQRMSYEAQGIYIRILCHMWSDSRDWCSIFNNDKAISSTLGISTRKWQSIKKEIQYENDPLFKEKNGKFFSLRLKKEAKKLKEYRAKQAEKGRKSALTRGTTVEPRLNRGATGGATKRQPPLVEPRCNSSISSSSSTTIDNKDKILANLLIELIKQNDLKAKAPKDDSSLYVKWVDQIRLCRERDGRSESEIEAAIRFSQEDDFWKGNILSATKLRKQMATLLHQSQRYKPDETGKAPPREKNSEEERRSVLIEKKRSKLYEKHKLDLDNADTLDKKRDIEALIATQIATYSRQLEEMK